MEKIIKKLKCLEADGKLKIDAVIKDGKGIMIEAASPYAKMPFFCDEAKGAFDELNKQGIRFEFLNGYYLAIATEKTNKTNRKRFLDFYNGLIQEPQALMVKREQIELDALLFGAAENGKIEEVEYILNEGADVNAKDDQGKTALMRASMNGRKKVAELLVNSKADVNAMSKTGWTALMYASKWDYREIAELLISNRADVNAKDIYGWTALMKASINGHNEIVEMLKRHGANEAISVLEKLNQEGV